MISGTLSLRSFAVFFCLTFFFPLPLVAEEMPITDLFTRQADSIVVVGTAGKRKKDNRAGSGFFISEDGLIVTNYHLIKRAKNIYVKLRNDQGYTKVKVLATDSRDDIAVIKIDGEGFLPVTLGQSTDVKVGQRVVAIGNPLGLESTVADGLISAWREIQNGRKVLQVSVPLSPGSSGGPLFNLAGEVIGITTASMSKGQSLNFAVPIEYAQPLIQQAQRKSPSRSRKRLAAKRTTSSVSKDVTPESGYEVYVIQKDDTLFGLAKRYRTSVDEIMQLNNLSDSQIYTGQTIKIPH